MLYNGVATRRRHSLLTNSGKWTRFLEPVRADHQIVGGYLRDGALALLLQLRLLYMEPVGPGLQPLLWLGLTTISTTDTDAGLSAWGVVNLDRCEGLFLGEIATDFLRHLHLRLGLVGDVGWLHRLDGLWLWLRVGSPSEAEAGLSAWGVVNLDRSVANSIMRFVLLL